MTTRILFRATVSDPENPVYGVSRGAVAISPVVYDRVSGGVQSLSVGTRFNGFIEIPCLLDRP